MAVDTEAEQRTFVDTENSMLYFRYEMPIITLKRVEHGSSLARQSTATLHAVPSLEMALYLHQLILFITYYR